MMVFTAIEIASFGAAEGRKHEDGIQESNPGEFFVPLRQGGFAWRIERRRLGLELERDFKSSRPQRQTHSRS